LSFEIAVQTAIFNKLNAYAPLKSLLVGDGIYDFVPQKENDCFEWSDKQFPFVTIGEAIHTEFDTFTSLGDQVVATIHTWSRDRGRKQIKELQGHIYDALHRKELTYTGFDIISCDRQGSESFRDADGLTYHGVQTFGILIGKIGS
jgi:hypothetical protein